MQSSQVKNTHLELFIIRKINLTGNQVTVTLSTLVCTYKICNRLYSVMCVYCVEKAKYALTEQSRNMLIYSPTHQHRL